MTREKLYYKPCSTCHNHDCVFVGKEDTHEVCEDYQTIKALEQEPCEDAISRQEVLYLIANDDLSMGQVVRGIHALPPVAPQEPRWIPVSERLPEDRREVLVTAYWHETYQVMMASYYGGGLWWCVPFNNCGEHMQRLNPKAWMPLLKPFEPQEREDKGV